MMDRAARCRRAARDAVADVEPPRLHDVIADTLDGASMTPGVLTLESAAATDTTVDLESIVHRAAGVQLIYEGLRLTRRLAHEEPWVDAGGEPEGDDSTETTAISDEQNTQSDLEILAADILVARGFYVLARTDAAGKAVRTVQAFGRDQTLRDEPGADTAALDANLERDVLELATLTGATAVGSTPTPTLLAMANDIAEAVGVGFPPAAVCVPVGSSITVDSDTRNTREATDGGTGTEADTETDADTAPRDGSQTDTATSATDP